MRTVHASGLEETALQPLYIYTLIDPLFCESQRSNRKALLRS